MTNSVHGARAHKRRQGYSEVTGQVRGVAEERNGGLTGGRWRERREPWRCTGETAPCAGHMEKKACGFGLQVRERGVMVVKVF